MDTNLSGHLNTTACKNERRTARRQRLAIPGRIIWRDAHGTPRFSSIVTRDVSESSAYVECLSGPPIPMHRLVYLQLDKTPRGSEFVPAAFQQGKVLSAVYRVGPVSTVTGLPDGYALRLLVEPAHAVAPPSAFAAESLALPA